MKMLRTLLIMAVFLFRGALHAQTGDVAVETVETGKSNDWQNWTFLGVAIVTASIAVVVVSLNSGHSAPD